MDYESYEVVPSKVHPGVTYTVNRMSFGRRLELMRRVREIAPKLECFQGGTSKQDQIESGLLSAEVDRLYLEWGLKEIGGLTIDGEPADPAKLAESGPEELFTEAVRCVRAACHLSQAEIKN
jgi:hypothetical protein